MVVSLLMFCFTARMAFPHCNVDKFSRNDPSLQVSQLVKKEGEGFLIARVFFDFDGVQDANANEINYNKVYIQPGNVALPYPDSPHIYFHNWEPQPEQPFFQTAVRQRVHFLRQCQSVRS